MYKSDNKSLEPKCNPLDVSLIFMNAFDQLKDEHNGLKNKLHAIYTVAAEVMRNEKENPFEALEALEDTVDCFDRELDRHSEWEERALFPLMGYYAKEAMAQLHLMEQEHELAKNFFQGYRDALQEFRESYESKDPKEIATFLVQAFYLLDDHFIMEEQYILTLGEQILTDMDYMFS